MTRTLIRVSSYARLQEEGARFLRRHAGSLLIGATRGAGDDLLRAASGAGGFTGVHVMTLTQLAAQLAAPEFAARRLTPASRLSQEALVTRALYDLADRGQLPYFGPVALKPGFPRALLATLNELRMEDRPWASIEESGEPGADLAALGRLYVALLEEQGLADAALLYRLAREGGLGRFAGLPLLLADVPVREKLARELVLTVARQAPETLALILQDDTETVEALEGALDTVALPDPDRGADEFGLTRLRRHLFAPSTPGGSPPGPDPAVAYFSAPGENLECIEIARRVRDLARGGVPLDAMAVVVRSPERYQPLLEEAFRRASIPTYFTKGAARPDTAGRALLALLACARERCSASRFAEYLSLAQVPERDAGGAPIRREDAIPAPPSDEIVAAFRPGDGAAVAFEDPEPGESLVAPSAWERLLIDAAVIGGPERWSRRLSGLEFEVRLHLNRMEDPDDAERARLERRLAQLRGLKSFALPLIRLLAELPEAASWGGWIDRLREIAETALRDPGRPLALLEELGPMRAAGPVTLGEVYSVLEERLRFLRRDPPLRRYGRLFVSTPEEARGRVFDHVFVLGLAEGIFPQRTQEDPLLLDVYRRPLGLKLRDHRVERERLLLRIPAAAAQSGFVASYPRLDTAQSRPRVPSFYALEVARAVEGRLPELRAFEAGAAQGAPARIGWPAPPDPAEAIDNAEYDLARLEQFTERGVEAARGWGRYLVELSDPLTRSLRARWKRWRPRWFDADGLVDPESGALELLRDSSLARQAYSPSALQQFTACPYRFFLQGVVRLRPREEPEPLAQMDPLTRGVLFHRAQQRLLEGLKSESRWPVTAATFSDAMDLADQELSRAAVDLAEDLAPAIPRVWRNEVEALRTDLRGWLREIAQEGAEWYPLHVEREFEQALPNGLRVRGVADLVEQHGVTRLLRITDHKTGKPPEGPRLGYVGGGAVLQPLLYAVALELALDQPVDRARLYYCTQRGGFRQTEIRLDQRARAYLTGALDVIQRSIVEGFLPAYPAKDACGKCEYLDLCGPYEELRTKSKPKPRLEPLLALRSMP